MKKHVTEQDIYSMELLGEALTEFYAEFYETFAKDYKKTMKNKKGGNKHEFRRN